MYRTWQVGQGLWRVGALSWWQIAVGGIFKVKDSYIKFAGRTKIINPKGEIIQELGEYEGISCVELDDVKAQRENLTYLKDLNLKLCRKMYKNLRK